MQHARRQIQETSAYYDRYVKHQTYYTKRDPFNIITEDQFYYKMNEFTQNFLIPIIRIKKEDSEKIKGYKKMIKLIIFEVIHEKAWPITALAICRCIPLLYDIFPVESLIIVNENDNTYIDTSEDQFEDPTTLSNLRGKIRHNFYDKADDVNNIIIPEVYRTSQTIAICAKILLSLLGCKCNPDMSLLLKLTKDTKYADEFAETTSVKTPDIPNDSFDTTYTPDELNKLKSCDKLVPSNIVALSDTLNIPHLPENINKYIDGDFSNDVIPVDSPNAHPPPGAGANSKTLTDAKEAHNPGLLIGGRKMSKKSKWKYKGKPKQSYQKHDGVKRSKTKNKKTVHNVKKTRNRKKYM